MHKQNPSAQEINQTTIPESYSGVKGNYPGQKRGNNSPEEILNSSNLFNWHKKRFSLFKVSHKALKINLSITFQLIQIYTNLSFEKKTMFETKKITIAFHYVPIIQCRVISHSVFYNTVSYHTKKRNISA